MAAMENTLIAHDHWATHRVLDMLSHLETIPDKAAVILEHMLVAHAHWYARVTNTQPDLPLWGSSLSLHDCASMADEYFGNWKTVIAEDDLDRVITYRNSSGREFSNTIREILHHLCMHGQYHRGQVVIHTRHLVDSVPSTDLIVFLRERDVVL